MQRLSGDIVDCVVGIMDERPEPMKNYKPAQRINNGLERFRSDHQERYEARGERSGSRVGRVTKHYAAHPKMYDELDRRTSLTKVIAFRKKSVSKLRSDSLCDGCIKMQKSKHKRRLTKSMMRTKAGTRVASPRAKRNSNAILKSNRRKRKLGVHCVTKGSQCAYVAVRDKRMGTDCAANSKMEHLHMLRAGVDLSKVLADADVTGRVAKASEMAPESMLNSKSNSKSKSKSTSQSVNSSINPDTSVASASTFHSFATLDQEPMV